MRGQLDQQPLELMVGGIAGGGHEQVGDEQGHEKGLFLGRVDGAIAGADQVAPDRVTLDPAPGCGLAHERVVRLVGHDQVPRGVVHCHRRVGQSVEEALHAPRDASRDEIAPRGSQAREPEEQLVLGVRQPQRPGEGLHDLRRR